MKVLMTLDGVGGVLTYATELTAGLTARGVEVAAVGFGPALSRSQRTALARAGAWAVYDTGLALEWMADPWSDLERAAGRLAELEARERPDVIVASAFFCGALRWRAPVLVVAHSCVLSWWRAVHGVPAPSEWERYRRVVSAGLAGADAVVTPTRAMAAMLAREYPEAMAARTAEAMAARTAEAMAARTAEAMAARTAEAMAARTLRPVTAGVAAVQVIANASSSTVVAPDAPRAAVVLAAGRTWDEAKNLDTLRVAATRMRHPVLIAGEVAAGGGGRAAGVGGGAAGGGGGAAGGGGGAAGGGGGAAGGGGGAAGVGEGAAAGGNAPSGVGNAASGRKCVLSTHFLPDAHLGEPDAADVAVAGGLGDLDAIPSGKALGLGRLAPEELAALRARVAVFAAPARYEPFGLAILEAARSGCALLLGDIPSLRELWDGAAEFVDPADPDALARAADHLVDDPLRRAGLAAAAARRASRYGTAAMTERYLLLLDALTASRARERVAS